MIALYIVIALVVLLALYWVLQRNSMVRVRNQVDEAWSGIDVQLKRRHDLVPNLVETVKGYATHEREVFEKTAQARAQAMAARTPAESSRAEGQLTQALTDLRAVAENYPELRGLGPADREGSAYAAIIEAAIARGDVPALAYELGRADATGESGLAPELTEAALRRLGALPDPAEAGT